MKFCDLKCAFAEAARSEMDGSRSCMTFTALYCTLFKRHVMKSQPCEDRVERGGKERPREPGARSQEREP